MDARKPARKPDAVFCIEHCGRPLSIGEPTVNLDPADGGEAGFAVRLVTLPASSQALEVSRILAVHHAPWLLHRRRGIWGRSGSPCKFCREGPLAAQS